MSQLPSPNSLPAGPAGPMSSSLEPQPDRRQFLKTTAALSAAAALGPLARAGGAYAAGTDTIRVGLIGCGGRGTGAAENCVRSSEGVTIVAMGDLFADRLAGSRTHLAGRLGEKFAVTDEHTFVGFDAVDKVCALPDVDLVILTTPPVFRPLHLEKAIAAGKNVFMEKPVAVDPAGIRTVIAASREAKKKRLAIVSGTQRRHQQSYLETMQRIHDGAIGELTGGFCYWNQGGLWVHERQEHYTDVEWQLRNWLYFSWTSGDHIVEQHVHNLDVMNWAFGGPPVKAMGMGGRQVRTDEKYGNIYDHFAIEYEYEGGHRVVSQCRQIDGCAGRVGEHLVGTEGTSDPNRWISGAQKWRFEGDERNPYEQEHADLIASIRANEPLNEGERIAESTLTAIMGRMSAYTGKLVTWDFALGSTLDITPTDWSFADHRVDGVAVPGRTPLV